VYVGKPDASRAWKLGKAASTCEKAWWDTAVDVVVPLVEGAAPSVKERLVVGSRQVVVQLPSKVYQLGIGSQGSPGCLLRYHYYG